MPTVLFLCTGNYYRSRFAEIYFNWLTGRRPSAWRADSRGLALDPANAGPLSIHARNGLARLGIPLPESLRLPGDLTLQDLDRADLVIAVKEAEHRPLLERRFPDWTERVQYWHIHDIDFATPDEALPVLERHVFKLVEDLKRQATEQVRR